MVSRVSLHSETIWNQSLIVFFAEIESYWGYLDCNVLYGGGGALFVTTSAVSVVLVLSHNNMVDTQYCLSFSYQDTSLHFYICLQPFSRVIFYLWICKRMYFNEYIPTLSAMHCHRNLYRERPVWLLIEAKFKQRVDMKPPPKFRLFDK
jgi:hypothetical protein